MRDVFSLIWLALIGLFRSRASLQVEILTLCHQLNVLRRKSPTDANISLVRWGAGGLCAPARVSWRRHHDLRHLATWVPGTGRPAKRCQKSRISGCAIRSTEEDAHGYHHATHHCTSHSAAGRRRLVRPWTLVLNAADLKLARRCNAAGSD
jgi:hypothetical protein